MMIRQLELEQLMKVEEHEDQVGHLLLLPMTASKFQMKGTLKEHKSNKENIEEKPDVNTRKPIVKCNKLIVYDETILDYMMIHIMEVAQCLAVRVTAGYKQHAEVSHTKELQWAEV